MGSRLKQVWRDSGFLVLPLVDRVAVRRWVHGGPSALWFLDDPLRGRVFGRVLGCMGLDLSADPDVSGVPRRRRGLGRLSAVGWVPARFREAHQSAASSARSGVRSDLGGGS